MEFLTKVEALVASGSATGCALNESLNTVDRAISLYGWSKLAMTFNGGKDSTAMLHIVRAVAFRRARRKLAGTGTPEALDAEARQLLGQMVMVYFDNGDDFDEIMEFTREAAAENEMKLLWYKCSYREGLQRLMDETGATAVLMGTRKSDPHAASLSPFTPTSAGWPPMMRVNPVLHWDYELIWDFMRTCGVRYCVLYDMGYTSLGSKASSAPNPLLRRTDGTYRPAYELADGHMEREGRTVSRHAPQPTRRLPATAAAAAAPIESSGGVPITNARVAALASAASTTPTSAASTPAATPLSAGITATHAAATGRGGGTGSSAGPVRATVVHVDGAALRGARAPRGLLPVGRALFANGVHCARAAVGGEEDGAAVAAQVASGVSATDVVLVVCHATPSLPICAAAVAQAIGVPLQRHQPLALALARAAKGAMGRGSHTLKRPSRRVDAPQNGVLVWPRREGADGARRSDDDESMVALTVGPVAIIADASVPHALLDSLHSDAEPDADHRPWRAVVEAVLAQWETTGVLPRQRPTLALELEAEPASTAGGGGGAGLAGLGAGIGVGVGPRAGVVAVATVTEVETEEGKDVSTVLAPSPYPDLPDGTRTPSVPLAGHLLHGTPVRVRAGGDEALRALLRAACGCDGPSAAGAGVGGDAAESVSSSPTACSEELPKLLPRGPGAHGDAFLEALLRGEPRVGAALGVVRVAARLGRRVEPAEAESGQ
eukprot:CAMPEP_0196799150 /NCGR_PEP_ID=MMETSP1104-20130614/39496_1 /TAXON_ID=33652 /ORGANISM="Cafeteria sp., Strain Caron Lab Isolate" /LENGTH=721 /DNA_ID=CAMNT_0042169559 /DNA_START=18 /DNA_END=2183 /DNA_ORIENTATION=+